MTARLSRSFLWAFAALVLALALLQFTVRDNARPAEFLGGTEAPVLADLLSSADTVAVIPADRIGTGEVREIMQHDAFTYVLHSEQWIRAGSGLIEGPFGRGADGAPGVFNRAIDILVTDTLVYVLEALPARIIAFRHDGTYTKTYRVRSGDSASVYVTPEQFDVVNDEFRVLLTHFDPSGRADRELVAGRGSTWTRMFWLPSDSLTHLLDTVLLGTTADSTAALLTTLSYRFYWLDRGGAVRSNVRANPPRFSIPDSARWAFDRKFAGVPADLRERISLPEFIPPVRAFSILPGGYATVATSRDMEAVSIEVLDPDGAPLWRSPNVFSTPVFLHGKDFFRVDEQPNHLVVLRHHIKGGSEWPK